MCGIVGLLSFNGNVGVWRAEIESSISLMARRGPDDERVWSDERACILGFRRLAILDLSPAGAQPMVSADGRRSEEHTSELQSQSNLVCRLLLEKKKYTTSSATVPT